MNRVTLIFLCIILIFLFIIYIVFLGLGVDIISEVYNFLLTHGLSFFGGSAYAFLAIGMVVIIILALILFKLTAGK